MSTNKKVTTASAGFTLIELMIAMVIVGLVLASVIGVFTRSNRLYTLENARSSLQLEMQSAVEVMARDMRMAVYDPMNSKNFEIKTAQAIHFRFASDLNENGVIDLGAAATAGCEVTSFRYSAANNKVDWICGENTGSQELEPLIGDTDIQVTGLDFDYRNNQNLVETNIYEISGVVITLNAQISAGQAGMESRSYSTWVDLRNAGPNASRN